MRAPETEQFWTEEAQFCEQEGRQIRRMPGFHSYCLMQANFAWKDGFQALGERIAKAAGLHITPDSHARWLRHLEARP